MQSYKIIMTCFVPMLTKDLSFLLQEHRQTILAYFSKPTTHILSKHKIIFAIFPLPGNSFNIGDFYGSAFF